MDAQQTLKSTSQKECQWNIDTQKDENCVEKQKDYKISINQAEENIQITSPETTTYYKIVNTEKETDYTLFKVVSETGVGKSITYNTADGWLKITNKELNASSIILYYFINEQ